MTDYKQDYNNGQIHGWNGGECPVHPETVVNYWLRDSRAVNERLAINLRWTHAGAPADIIAFQVVKDYVEPKVIWVNEYGSFGSVWQSEQEAREGASVGATRAARATRIAVKYVEARDD